MENNKNSWYKINMKATEKTADIYIYDEIGEWGITAKDFIEDFRNLKDMNVDLHINCVGGEIFDGMAIYNTIKKHNGTVTAYIEGLAASMGSVIPLAADKVVMSENSLLMIHNAWGGAVGEAKDMRKRADMLEKLSGEIANIYEKKTVLDRVEIDQMMNDETWFNAEEAMKAGFVDVISDSIQVAAKYDVSKFKNITEKQMNNQLNINKKSTKMTEELKSWFSAQVETIVNSVKGTNEVNTEATEINVNLIDNEEIKNKLSELESKVAELNTSLSAKEEETTELSNSISNLTTENEELTTKVNKAEAIGTKVETDKDPSVVTNKVEDANSGFYNMMAGMLKNRVNN
jgi:ATP-dependent Clp endopeptidase proteolytic subunit ClpP